MIFLMNGESRIYAEIYREVVVLATKLTALD